MYPSYLAIDLEGGGRAVTSDVGGWSAGCVFGGGREGIVFGGGRAGIVDCGDGLAMEVGAGRASLLLEGVRDDSAGYVKGDWRTG